MVFKKGHKISEAQKEMMRKRMTGKKNPFYGKTHSEDVKKKMRERVQSKETRRKISLAGKGRKHTEATKRKIGQAHKGKKLSEKSIQKMKTTMKKRFPQGRIPWHKGKTGVFSEEALEKIRKRRAKQILPRKNSIPEIKLQKLLKSNKIKFISHKNFNLGSMAVSNALALTQMFF